MIEEVQPYRKTDYKPIIYIYIYIFRVYNDIVTTIGRDNGAMLVLLDLSTASDTIDRDQLFFILKKYVAICGNALKLIKSYFSNHTQRVQIDNVLSDYDNIICGVP